MNQTCIDKMFEVVALGGNAQELAIEAIELAKNGEYIEAYNYLDKAKRDYKLASIELSSYLKLIQNSDDQKVDILVMHANEYVSSARITINYASELVEIYKLISNLKS